jgi:signal transduction histidine kinase
LVSDILHVNRIESGRLELNKKEFDLNKLIKKIVIDFQFSSEKHFVEANGKIKGKVFGDPERIEQVVSNLISNAIKYSPDSEKVIINLTQNKNEAIISVVDYGIGISKIDQKRIFERFYRIRENNQKEGFGLGLYIASEIIKRHNGKIWLKSTEGEGSTFYFSLPIKQKRKLQ